MVDQTVQTVVDWVYMVGPLGVYLIIIGVAYLENVVPPIPGDVLLAFGGYLAAEGLIQVFPLWFFTVIASVIGFLNMYWIGSKLGGQINENRHDHILLKFVNYKYIEKGRGWMNKYGQWVIVANRFLAGTRSVIAITAGMSHLNAWKTAINSFISSAFWNAILVGAGWFVRDNWQVIGEYLSVYGKVILIGIVVLAVIWIFRLQKRSSSPNDGQE